MGGVGRARGQRQEAILAGVPEDTTNTFRPASRGLVVRHEAHDDGVIHFEEGSAAHLPRVSQYGQDAGAVPDNRAADR